MNKLLLNLDQTMTEAEQARLKSTILTVIGGGADTAKVWIPSVAQDGTISWAPGTASTSAPTPANIKGPQGDKGQDGSDGQDGQDGTSVTITNVEPITGGNKIHFSDGTTVTVTNGQDGAGVAVKGTVATKADLPANAENGDAYIVTAEDGKLFVYAGSWPDEGVAFTGPKGEDGDTPTLTFDENAEKTGVNIFVNGATEPAATILYGKKGDTGDTPTMTTTPIEGGNSLFADGTKLCDILNGTPGSQGASGYSPLVTITTTASGDLTGNHVEIKYGHNGSQTSGFDVWNGKNGDPASETFTSVSANSAYFSGKGTSADPLDVQTSAFLLTSGGTVSGNLVVSAGTAYNGFTVRRMVDNVEHNTVFGAVNNGVFMKAEAYNGGDAVQVNARNDGTLTLEVNGTTNTAAWLQASHVLSNGNNSSFSAVDTVTATDVGLPIQRLVAVTSIDQVIASASTLADGFGAVFFVLSSINS